MGRAVDPLAPCPTCGTPLYGAGGDTVTCIHKHVWDAAVRPVLHVKRVGAPRRLALRRTGDPSGLFLVGIALAVAVPDALAVLLSRLLA